MKKYLISPAELIILKQDSEPDKISMEGRLTKGANNYTFVETKAHRRNPPRPHLYEGNKLFLVQKDDGTLEIYIKRIAFGSHGTDAKAVIREINREFAEAAKVVENVINN